MFNSFAHKKIFMCWTQTAHLVAAELGSTLIEMVWGFLQGYFLVFTHSTDLWCSRVVGRFGGCEWDQHWLLMVGRAGGSACRHTRPSTCSLLLSLMWHCFFWSHFPWITVTSSSWKYEWEHDHCLLTQAATWNHPLSSPVLCLLDQHVPGVKGLQERLYHSASAKPRQCRIWDYACISLRYSIGKNVWYHVNVPKYWACYG